MKHIVQIVLISLSILNGIACYGQYSGGSGTETDPYRISTLDDLKMLSDSSSHWNRYFELTTDIDASPTMTWNGGKGFGMIGQMFNAFSGGLDGKGHKISHMYINRMGEDYVGMFSVTAGGYIRNLELEQCNVKATSCAGTLVGSTGWYDSGITEISGIIITGCKVGGGRRIGGLIGEINRGRIENCTVNDTVTGSQGLVGGLVGVAFNDDESWVKGCKVHAVMSGASETGGLIGKNMIEVSHCQADILLKRNHAAYGSIGGLIGNNSYHVHRCQATGEIRLSGSNVEQVGGFTGLNSGVIWDCSSSVEVEATKGKYVGGFVGENDKSISSSYASGKVTGNTFTGGFAGYSTLNSYLTDCYSTGTTAGNDRTGGFLGENSYFATCSRCYSSGKVVSSAWFSGGFSGLNRSTAHTEECFFDRETSGMDHSLGMDHNGQNPNPDGLQTAGFAGQQAFLDAGWEFGYSSQQPWQMGMAPDGFFRPVFYFQQYQVTFMADTGGYLEPDSLTEQRIYIGKNTYSVNATGQPNHRFYAWYSSAGDSLTNKNPLNVSDVRCDTVVIARFNYIDKVDDLPTSWVKIYPNPASVFLAIEWDPWLIPAERSYSLSDIHGREVIRRNSDSNTVILDIGSLDPGIYLLEIRADNSRLHRKIVIQ